MEVNRSSYYKNGKPEYAVVFSYKGTGVDVTVGFETELKRNEYLISLFKKHASKHDIDVVSSSPQDLVAKRNVLWTDNLIIKSLENYYSILQNSLKKGNFKTEDSFTPEQIFENADEAEIVFSPQSKETKAFLVENGIEFPENDNVAVVSVGDFRKLKF